MFPSVLLGIDVYHVFTTTSRSILEPEGTQAAQETMLSIIKEHQHWSVTYY